MEIVNERNILEKTGELMSGYYGTISEFQLLI